MNPVEEFERMRNLAEAKALSKASLQRPLTEREFQRYKEACKNIGIEART